MSYAKIENGEVVQYPYSFHHLRKDNPSTSFPKTSMEDGGIRSSYGVVEVISVGVPTSETHNVTEATPTEVNGNWTQTWDQTPKTEMELELLVIAARRSEYGPVENQIEFITENGLEAWQTRVAEIKLRHPKL